MGQREGDVAVEVVPALEVIVAGQLRLGFLGNARWAAASHEDDQRRMRITPNDVAKELLDRAPECSGSLPEILHSAIKTARWSPPQGIKMSVFPFRLKVSPADGPKRLLRTTSRTSRSDSSGIVAKVFGRRSTAVVTLSISDRMAAKPSSEIAGSGVKALVPVWSPITTGRGRFGGSTAKERAGSARACMGTSRNSSSSRSARTFPRRSSICPGRV